MAEVRVQAPPELGRHVGCRAGEGECEGLGYVRGWGWGPGLPGPPGPLPGALKLLPTSIQ